MFFKRKKKANEVDVKAWFEGTAMPLEQVNDPMISGKVVGDGVAIEPTSGNVYAPVDGSIASIFDTKHAIGFALENGAELLMHMGIDTVELKGEGIDLNISVGDQVKAGDCIGTMDLEFVKSKGKGTVTPVLLTNMDTFSMKVVTDNGNVSVGDVMYKIIAK